MSAKRTYFLSDLHLGARYIENPRAHEMRIVRMLRSFEHDAEHIYLLGDVLDYWFEYKTVVPRGYIRFFGELARLADAGIAITWIVGNHDIWLFDYLRNEIGIEIVDGSITRQIGGKMFYLAHGDALGSLKPGFKFIRALFRNRVCQKLYSGIHPRWTVPFAHRWSSGSRKKGDSRYREWQGDDKEPSYVYACRHTASQQPRLDFFVTGHRHLAVDKTMPSGCRFVMLGDCFEKFTYAVWNGNDLKLCNDNNSTETL